MPPKYINGKKRPEKKLNSGLLCMGKGRSAFFFTSLLPAGNPAMIVTDHGIDTSRVESMWGTTDIFFSHSHKIAEIKNFIINSLKNNGTLTIPITTDPKRGKQWLDRVLKNKEIRDILQENKDKVYIALIQSPNQFRDEYLNEGYNVLQLDFYPGIGGVAHDAQKKVTKVQSGVKESVFWTHSKLTQISPEEEIQAENIVTHLCANQELVIFEHPLQLDLLPTNAILHSVGITTNVCVKLVDENHLHESILQKKTSAEFFEVLNGFLDNVGNDELQLMIGKLMKDKKFYKSMPEVGPNVLMKEASDVVIEIRKALLRDNQMPASQLDEIGEDGVHTNAHIYNHLRLKYLRQFAEKNLKSAYDVDFATFVTTNPAYQNEAIVFPTKDDGTINGDDRFFVEESATLNSLITIGKEKGIDISILENIMRFLDRIAQISKTHIEERTESKPDPSKVSEATAKKAEEDKDKGMPESKL